MLSPTMASACGNLATNPTRARARSLTTLAPMASSSPSTSPALRRPDIVRSSIRLHLATAFRSRVVVTRSRLLVGTLGHSPRLFFHGWGRLGARQPTVTFPEAREPRSRSTPCFRHASPLSVRNRGVRPSKNNDPYTLAACGEGAIEDALVYVVGIYPGLRCALPL